MNYTLRSRVGTGLECISLISMLITGGMTANNQNLESLGLFAASYVMFICGDQLREHAKEEEISVITQDYKELRKEYEKLEKKSNRQDPTDTIEYFI